MRLVSIDTADSRKVESAPRRKRHHSPSDLRRDATRVQNQIEQRLVERSDAWASGEGRDDFTVIRQDGDVTPGRGDDAYRHRETVGSLKGLGVEKRNAMHGTQPGSEAL